MALLTTDDVLHKRFLATKFREGYDQDEVDDFLDEVAETLRELNAENEELREKLAAAERRIAELSQGGEAVAAPVVEAPVEPVVEPEPAPVVPEPVAAAPAVSEPESATSMLLLAQRLHDEYVANGRAEGDRLVAEARTEAERIVREAEDQHSRTLARLEQDRSLLERKIDELREYEAEYRQRLRTYLESLVENVVNTSLDRPTLD
ncbi:DivIVA domain-containing protein [Buchananella felis]|uniref:DivIVA domain-containing protein n=1 Tax=Buchananella felis TaxID=3231492 RepID=UPI003528B3B9